MNQSKFIEEVKLLGIDITEKQLNLLEKYYELLIEWNNKINLTRIVEKEEVYLKHFYDSLTIAKVINLNNVQTLLDFGTGAGFPGIVLKIFYPNLKITLVDSLNKRVIFLNEVIKELKLDNIEAIHIRVEDLKDNHYDIITTRAVSNLKQLILWINKLITKNTLFIPLKAHVEEEIKEAQNLMNKNKIKIVKKETFNLPIEGSLRNILVIRK